MDFKWKDSTLSVKVDWQQLSLVVNTPEAPAAAAGKLSDAFLPEWSRESNMVYFRNISGLTLPNSLYKQKADVININIF